MYYYAILMNFYFSYILLFLYKNTPKSAKNQKKICQTKSAIRLNYTAYMHLFKKPRINNPRTKNKVTKFYQLYIKSARKSAFLPQKSLF